MSAALIDRVDAFAERHARAISLVGIAWFALNCADNARFIDLPRLLVIGGTTGMIASGIANALWWGWLRPRIERRRASRSNPSEIAHG